MFIPGPRTAIMAFVNNVKAKIIQPSSKNEVIATLSDDDYNWQVIDSEGFIHSLDEFKDKVIFINFWATWCGPCIGEMPELQKFYDKFKDNEEVVFMFVSNEPLDKMKNFLADKGYNLPVYAINTSVPSKMESQTIPTSFLIDKKGNIVLKHKGVAQWGGDKMEKLVKDLL